MAEYASQVNTQNGYDWIKLMVVVIFIVTLFGVGVGVYWLFIDATPPAEIFSATPNKTVVEAGESFIVTLDWCKYTMTAASVYLTWVDDIMYPQPPDVPVFNHVGCFETDVLVKVPRNLPPSEYTVMAEAHYHGINPIAERSVPFEFGPLLVLEPKSYR